MTRFITHIEINEGQRTDYQRLGRKLNEASFKTIFIDAGKGRAEFSYEHSQSIKDVIDAVVPAVQKIGKKFSFTVIKEKFIPGYKNTVR